MPRYTSFDLWKKNLNLEPMSLAGHQFWCNPTSFRLVTERVVTPKASLNGFVRFSWGVKPYQIELVGFTGRGGLDELHDLESGIRPFFENGDRAVPWSFPARGITRWMVYLDYFEDSMENSNTQMHSYDIRMSRYPAEVDSYKSMVTPTLSIAAASNNRFQGGRGSGSGTS